jgi:oligoribonuclease NrnB/cAMP/cGMP phosphodiesterase (DHH superfamily)
MDEELIDSDSLSLSRKSQLPGAGFFYPDTLDEERAEQQAREAVEGAEVVVVADTDADGLGCVALIREAYDAAVSAANFEDPEPLLDDERGVGDLEAGALAEETDALDPETPTDEEREADDLDAEEFGDGEADGLDTDAEGAAAPPKSSVALLGAGPHNVEDALARVAEYAEPGVEVFVCDLCPDRFEYVEDALTALRDHDATVRWFDHHQWDESVAEQVREAGVDLVVGDSDEECTADVTLRSLDYDFPDYLHELAAVTRDHDLWLREDPRSDDLADYAYWTGAEEYVAVVGEYGADLPDFALAFVAERRVEKEALIEKALDRAEFHEIGEWTVGVTYGRCSQNEVAEGMREQDADASVIVKPAGSASIRGTDAFERCHEVAAQVNGGGHPKAAGCKPDIYDDMLDYAHHWTTQGSAARRVILAAFERLAEEEAEADDAEEAEVTETADADEADAGEAEPGADDADDE